MLCIVSVETTVYSHTHTHTHMFAQASLLEAENGTLTKRVAAEVKRRAEAENKATTLELQLENERQITADLKDQCESLRSQSTQVGRVATNVWLPPIFFPCDCLFLFPPFSSLAHIHYVSLSLTRIHAHTLSLSLSLSLALFHASCHTHTPAVPTVPALHGCGVGFSSRTNKQQQPPFLNCRAAEAKRALLAVSSARSLFTHRLLGQWRRWQWKWRVVALRPIATPPSRPAAAVAGRARLHARCPHG